MCRHSNIEKCNSDEVLTLSDEGTAILANVFVELDADGDQLLNDKELELAFYMCQFNPFEQLSSDYLSMVETKNGALTLDAWTSLWWYGFYVYAYQYVLV